MADPFIKRSVADYTEQEFVEFVDEIRKEDKAPTDKHADVLVRHFNEVIGHPDGMDLIYYPEPGADTSSAGIARTVAAWRAANGLPVFKQ
ncbi:colicin immunity protein/pyocin immunity protein [Pseudomonas baetica]|uniref:Colicin immunity protein/pyocin immunity protein n=1 Tax=Pseudomonas baetica TaxID=674054 RepID=A0ABX4Q373_9PSED|nr:bacteriocin immunity protein [Pseudomonas baetica]PKA71242.1 colicin immunity protein/pyocin immunity protein [Pseudomonas baetica]PTC19749.1 bacteriocin immunity protein [Pseudomonas baetica]